MKVSNACITKSGVKGVSWDVQSNKWRATIWWGGKNVHLGSYKDLEMAGYAYLSASLKRQASRSKP